MKKLILFLLFLISLSANAANKHYALRGTLGENIDFRLDLEEDAYHGIVIGQTTYFRKNGKISKINVYGNSEEETIDGRKYRSFRLCEFLGTKICGNFHFMINADGNIDSGCWTLGDKTYGMNDGMVELLDLDGYQTFFKPVDIENAGGVYKFSYASGNEGMPEYGGRIELYPYCKNVAYHICQVTPNIAETSGKMAEIFNNQFYLFVDGDIIYDVFAFEDVVFVKHTNSKSRHPESFGANADVEGIYIATDEALGEDVQKAFDEEINFTTNHPFSPFDLNEAWMEAVGGETTFPDEILMKDIDGDGNDEVIARYTAGKTEDYEVRGNRYVVFVVVGDLLDPVAVAQGDLENLEIADGYVVKNVMNSRNTRNIHNYFQLQNSAVFLKAIKTEAEINSFVIDDNTVKEKDFKKQIKIKNSIKITDLDGWQEVPGNVYRNETAARG